MGLRRVELLLGSTVARTLFSPAGQGGNGAGDDGVAPLAPQNLVATAANGQINLTWDETAGAKSYTVLRRTSPFPGIATTIASGLVTPAYSDNTVANGTLYYYAVYALNVYGNSPNSISTNALSLNNPYVAEDNSTIYVAEDGATFYYQEF